MPTPLRKTKDQPAANLWPIPVGDVLRQATPVALSYIPVGILYGALAQNAGLTFGQTISISLLVYSGAAQLLAAQMLAQGAAYLGIAAAATILTLRHLLMGASLTPYIKGLSPKAKALLSPIMTDESFALGWKRYKETRIEEIDQAHPFFFGVSLTLYITWNAASALGHIAGQAAPLLMDAGFDLIFPLLFVAVIAGLITTKAEGAAAIGALAFAAILRRWIPAEWLILTAGCIAAIIGVAFERPAAKGKRP